MPRIIAGREKTLIIISLGITMIALILLVAGLDTLSISRGRHLVPITNNTETPSPSTIRVEKELLEDAQRHMNHLDMIAKVVFWGFIPLSIIYVLLSSSDLKKKIIILSLTSVGIFLLFAFYYGFLQSVETEPILPAITPLPTSLPGTEVIQPKFTQPAHWLTLIIGFIVICSILLGALMYWQRINKPIESLGLLAKEAQLTIDKLRAGDDIKDTVIRCYYQMSWILDNRRGITRKSTMTPREFEKILHNIGLPGEQVSQLTRLFENVRYGGIHAGKTDDTIAINSLQAIVDAFGDDN